MKFYCFHFLPYAAADLGRLARGQKSMWMLYPHDYFDADACHALYARYLDELALVDELGFDGVCLNEHHQTPHSLMAAPNVIAGALTQRVKRGKILILGRALPLVGNPVSIAEEFAILDNMSGGRLITGFVRGIGVEYHASGINPAHSLERFRDAHDIILRAWTEREPFAYEGRHYRLNHVNIFPRPYQKPHPPVWIPSTGSKETLEWAAHPDRRYTYLQFFNAPYEGVKATLLDYRATARRFGYEATPDQLGWAVPTYVAETDAIARREAAPHLDALFNKFMALPPEMLFPPGYMSLELMKKTLARKKVGNAAKPTANIDQVIDQGIAMVGSAATVRARIEQAKAEIGLGHLLPMLHFGTLPVDLTRKNIEMFARDVMRPLRRQPETPGRQPAEYAAG